MKAAFIFVILIEIFSFLTLVGSMIVWSISRLDYLRYPWQEVALMFGIPSGIVTIIFTIVFFVMVTEP